MVQAERIVRTCSHCAEAQPPFGRICCASLALRAPVRSRALRGCNPTAFEYKDGMTRLRQAHNFTIRSAGFATTKCSRPDGCPKGNPEGLGEMMKRVLHEVQLAVPQASSLDPTWCHRHHHSTQHCKAQQSGRIRVSGFVIRKIVPHSPAVAHKVGKRHDVSAPGAGSKRWA